MNLKRFLLVSFLSISTVSTVLSQEASYPIIPKPAQLENRPGKFDWYKNTVIRNGAGSAFADATKELQQITGALKTTTKRPNFILIKKDPSITAAEGYKLLVEPSQISILAANPEGAFWAISTLKQLIGSPALKTGAAAYVVPAVNIADAPKFAWRGIHLDVSRHFFDMAYLRTFIDRMVLYKFNKFHIHLTDDQGWRIEIKKYPELTSKGAWRKMNGQDSVCLKLAKDNPDYNLPEKHFKTIDGERMYGGFYTQEEMRGLINYATARGVEIIPEVDMPGHMMAATKLMPWLTASGISQQGKTFSEPLCPCKETTYEFAENVFSEIFALFPSKYVHLGADEVEKDSWEKSEECKAMMKRENLKSVDELQSHFVHRMERFFNSKGKKMIGWDEILEGGVSPTATMMYWRAWVPKAPKHAAEKGLNMIMMPGEFCYFDAQQDGGSLKKVYGFDPYNYGFTKAEEKLVLGVQAGIWTEYIPSEARLEYMVFPRMQALSEVAWSNAPKDWTSFEKRMNAQYPFLDAMNINYRQPDLTGFSPKSVFVDQTVLKIINPLGTSVLRYTTNGTQPNVNSAVYNGQLLINKPTQVKIAAFRPNGKIGEVYTIDYDQQSYLKGVSLNKAEKGLRFSYYPKSYKTVTQINEADKKSDAITTAIEIPVKEQAPTFGTKHEGYFYAAEQGVYTFFLRADDGSNLYLNNKLLVDNDGLHSAIEKSAQIALGKGYHPFKLLFIEGGGGYTLSLDYVGPDGQRKTVNAADFSHE